MRQYSSALLAALCGLYLLSGFVYAAQPVLLRHQPLSTLNTFFSSTNSLYLLSQQSDFKKTMHSHFQQYYRGYPVWGGNAIVHVPQGGLLNGEQGLRQLLSANNNHATMNGVIYQYLEADLGGAPSAIFQSSQAEKALQQALQLHQQHSSNKNPITDTASQLIVYVDQDNHARWAFHVSFVDKNIAALPQQPNYILDAMTLQVYQAWDNIKTLESVVGGGFGGNEKTGRHVYDGLIANFPQLDILRDAATNTCYLQNADVTVKDVHAKKAVMQFACAEKSKQHNLVYWNASHDKINGAYSPANDALYIGKIIKDMYQQWYGLPVLTYKSQPMMLNMNVHANMENAYWDGYAMYFGDGGREFYPLVSLGVGAHEVSHGFTEQHSGLEYYGQSGGLNEAFSDMAAQAAEFYSTGLNSWMVGAEIMKAKNTALRYMDEPTKDCRAGDVSGQDCSINNAKDYKANTDVHFSSGVYNKMFYLLSTTSGWDAKKAFDVMVDANISYWTPLVHFTEAACGVVDATKDRNYSVGDVVRAFHAVGIETASC